MFDKPLVTIIVPAYNTEKYIDKCLASLLHQSYTQIEVIMIDDGSEDQTGEICKKYEKEDKRFILIQKKNTGVSDSRNIGIQSAKGKFLTFVDSDDYVTVDYIDTLVKEIADTELACAEYFLVTKNQIYPHVSKLMTNERKVMNAMDAINLLQCHDAFQGYLWNKIFLREIILKENIYFDSRVKIWEDMLFCLKYLTKIKCVTYIGKPIYYYVQRGNSAMSNNNIWEENTQLTAIDEMWKIARIQNGAFYNYIRDFYANNLAGLLGKNTFKEKESIIDTLKMIKIINGQLSLKHKIKVLFFKLKTKMYFFNNQ